MDALSDVLAQVQLTGAVFFEIDAAEPWVTETPPGVSIVNGIFPGTQHLVPYHIVTRGTAWGGAAGETPVRLEEGDVIVFPHGDAHTLSSAPGMRGTVDATLYRRRSDRPQPHQVTMGASAATTHLVCGYLGCDARPFNPLLAALPRVLHAAGADDEGLRALVSLALSEARARTIGSETVLGRISELLFVHVVRRYVAAQPPDRAGWLAGLRDPLVGSALGALHAEPARAWDLADLAQAVGTSRTVLAERFSHFVGRPPMQYLMQWRMQLAARELRGGTDTVAAIAERVGYTSEAAFSRAFKKHTGFSPGAWRTNAARTGT